VIVYLTTEILGRHFQYIVRKGLTWLQCSTAIPHTHQHNFNASIVTTTRWSGKTTNTSPAPRHSS
jgi:hypothetical protein